MSMARFLAVETQSLVVSEFASAEVASALSRRARMALLTDTKAGGRLLEFDVRRASATDPIDFQPSDFRLANIFVRSLDLGLRAPDAFCRRGGLALVTLDRRLAGAAETLDIRVAIPS